jgi:hypothetical protein
MISVASYPAQFSTTDGGGRKVWHPCEVVGVCGDLNDLQFIIIARGPIEYVDRVPEVRRRLPMPEPLG